jgi:small subunit ribosomal protein S20
MSPLPTALSIVLTAFTYSICAVSNMSRLRTQIKNVLESTNKEKAQIEYVKAVSTIDKAVGRGLIHKNTAGRRKSQITRHLNSLK